MSHTSILDKNWTASCQLTFGRRSELRAQLLREARRFGLDKLLRFSPQCTALDLAQIEKVSAQVEAVNAAPNLVINTP